MPPSVFKSHKPTATTKKSSRHRPLHACAVSVLAIADIAFRKTQEFDGPLGSTWRRMAKLAKFVSHFFYAMQYQWLAILSFYDDHFLAFAKIFEKMCPSSACVFDKIEEIVLMIMSLPEKFDDTVSKMPAIIYQFPIIEWALVRVISWLNCLISTLNRWGLENSRINEKRIDIVTTCNEQLGSALDSSYIINKQESKESFASISEDLQAESPGKVSYKEALERGKEKILEKKKIDEGECEGEEEKDKDKESQNIVKCPVGKSGSTHEDDSLLQLFDSKWLTRPVSPTVD